MRVGAFSLSAARAQIGYVVSIGFVVQLARGKQESEMTKGLTNNRK